MDGEWEGGNGGKCEVNMDCGEKGREGCEVCLVGANERLDEGKGRGGRGGGREGRRGKGE